MNDDPADFRERVVEQMEQLLAAGARPRRTPERIAKLLRRIQGAPEVEPIPAEPELISIWRQIVAYREWLAAAITRWADPGFALGDIPSEGLRQLRDELERLDEKIASGTRWKGNDGSRGHTLEQLRALASAVANAERVEAIRWIEMWLVAKSTHPRGRERRGGRDIDPAEVSRLESTVRVRLGCDDIHEIERRARALRGEDDYGDFAKLAGRIADLARG
jgi:hypothetical protein